VLEDGLLVVAAISCLVHRDYGVGQSADAHHNNGGFAQVAAAHYTPPGHHSYRVNLNTGRRSESAACGVRRNYRMSPPAPVKYAGDKKSTRRPSNQFVSAWPTRTETVLLNSVHLSVANITRAILQ